MEYEKFEKKKPREIVFYLTGAAKWSEVEVISAEISNFQNSWNRLLTLKNNLVKSFVNLQVPLNEVKSR